VSPSINGKESSINYLFLGHLPYLLLSERARHRRMWDKEMTLVRSKMAKNGQTSPQFGGSFGGELS